MKCTESLIQEHKMIHIALNILDEMAERFKSRGLVDDADIDALLTFLKRFADDHHQGKEESALFPAMLRASKGEEYRTVTHMVFEHDQERSLIKGLDDALLEHQREDFFYYADRLTSILRTHIYKEENIMFPCADALLSAKDDEDVTAQFTQFDRTMPKEAQEMLDNKLRTLERKYLARQEASQSPD